MHPILMSVSPRARAIFAATFACGSFALLIALAVVILSLCGAYRDSIPPHLTMLLVSLGVIIGIVFAGLIVALRAAAFRLAQHLS